MKRALLISMLLLVGGGTTIALDAPSAPSEHTILISIFDEGGHPVRQLSTDSVQVAENGQPVKILRLRLANDAAILFTVVVDTSKWAQQEKTSVALDGVVDFLSRVVRKDDRIVIASFSDRFHYGDPTSDLGQAKKEINNLNWGVRSVFYDALVQLPVMLMPLRLASERQIVILLTDGNDSASKATLNDVIASVEASGIVIFAIDTRYVRRKRAGFEEEKRLAEESGGRCFEFVSDKELQNAFKTIQASIENQYFLTYVPTPEPHAKIRVRADDVRVFAPRRR